MEIEILFEDASLLVVNKPSGLLVHRTLESRDQRFLLQELRNQIGGRHLYPVHRLDRAASGAIAFALSSEIARGLQESLSASDTEKEYLALVRGVAPEAGEIDRPLTSERGVAQEARTNFVRAESFERSTLLRVRILTGRRHQIRRHLSHIRHPILGDSTYGKGGINRLYRERYGLSRLFLHCHRLTFCHPVQKETLRIEAPLASDLEDVLKKVRDSHG